MEDHTEVRDAAQDVADALEQLKHAIEQDRELHDRLRTGGGGVPYELRNLLADLEGEAGGWLMGKGESFREQVETLVDFCAQPGAEEAS